MLFSREHLEIFRHHNILLYVPESITFSVPLKVCVVSLHVIHTCFFCWYEQCCDERLCTLSSHNLIISVEKFQERNFGARNLVALSIIITAYNNNPAELTAREASYLFGVVS